MYIGIQHPNHKKWSIQISLTLTLVRFLPIDQCDSGETQGDEGGFIIWQQMLSINLGVPGSRIAHSMFETIHRQQFLDNVLCEGLSTFHYETQKGTFPNCLYVDYHHQLDQIQSHTNIYSPQSFIGGTHETSTASDVFGQTHYNYYQNIEMMVRNSIVRMMDRCDQVQGVLCNASLGGGTGSGLCSQILKYFREDSPKNMIHTVRLWPDLDNSCSPIQVYNSVFSMMSEIQLSDLCLLHQNKAWQKLIQKQQRKVKPTTKQVNTHIGQSLAQLTLPYRFAGSLNTSPRKLCTNLVMYPRMHFTPFSTVTHSNNPLKDVADLNNFSLANYFDHETNWGIFDMHINHNSWRTSQSEICSVVKGEMLQKGQTFVEWLSSPVHMSINPTVQQESASLIVNSSHIQRVYTKLDQYFGKMFRRKAHVHHYLQAGMDEMEFTEAQSNLADLTSEYQQYGHRQFDQEDEDSEFPFSEG